MNRIQQELRKVAAKLHEQCKQVGIRIAYDIGADNRLYASGNLVVTMTGNEFQLWRQRKKGLVPLVKSEFYSSIARWIIEETLIERLDALKESTREDLDSPTPRMQVFTINEGKISGGLMTPGDIHEMLVQHVRD